MYYATVFHKKAALKCFLTLFLLLLATLIPIRVTHASNPFAALHGSYSVDVCENGTWRSTMKNMVYGKYGPYLRDGFLRFMPLKEYVFSRRLPRVTSSEDFSFRVQSKDPDVSLSYSYTIYDQNWGHVLHGKTTAPDLNSLDSGKYLMAIDVYAEKDDSYEKTLNLVWLIVGDYEESFVFKPLDDGNYALFEYCGIDEHVEIPSHYQESPVIKVENNAFDGNNVVKTIVVPEGIQEIGGFAFRSCSSLEIVLLPEGMTKIGEEAFANCLSLQEICLPDALTQIGRRAFQGCTSLKSIVIPEEIRKIERETFKECTSLNDVKLPSWLVSIEDGAFSGCQSLKNIEFPEGLISIGEGAFEGADLKNLVLPVALQPVRE